MSFGVLVSERPIDTNNAIHSSLVKESKASIEREQAVKFIRSFLDVKDGVEEISRAVVRTLVAVAEHVDDRLRSICIETLAEIRKLCSSNSDAQH